MDVLGCFLFETIKARKWIFYVADILLYRETGSRVSDTVSRATARFDYVYHSLTHRWILHPSASNLV